MSAMMRVIYQASHDRKWNVKMEGRGGGERSQSDGASGVSRRFDVRCARCEMTTTTVKMIEKSLRSALAVPSSCTAQSRWWRR